MTIKNLDGQQAVRAKYVEIGFQDFIDNDNVVEIELPIDCEITRGAVNVLTPWDTGTTHVADFGDSGVANRYKNDVDLKTAALVALVPTGFVTTPSNHSLRITSVPAGTAPTAGKLRIHFEYVQLGRSTSTQG